MCKKLKIRVAILFDSQVNRKLKKRRCWAFEDGFVQKYPNSIVLKALDSLNLRRWMLENYNNDLILCHISSASKRSMVAVPSLDIVIWDLYRNIYIAIMHLYLYKYENVCPCVCVCIRVFLGYLETDWDTLWHKATL